MGMINDWCGSANPYLSFLVHTLSPSTLHHHLSSSTPCTCVTALPVLAHLGDKSGIVPSVASSSSFGTHSTRSATLSRENSVTRKHNFERTERLEKRLNKKPPVPKIRRKTLPTISLHIPDNRRHPPVQARYRHHPNFHHHLYQHPLLSHSQFNNPTHLPLTRIPARWWKFPFLRARTAGKRTLKTGYNDSKAPSSNTIPLISNVFTRSANTSNMAAKPTSGSRHSYLPRKIRGTTSRPHFIQNGHP